VTILVYKKYNCNLDQAVRRGHPIDIAHCLRSIAAGLRHLHSIGLVHSDIKPENIFVLYPKAGKEMTVQHVIGDFHSVQNVGDVMMDKTGTPD
jgi:serine/threonine protein kinase